ncbi:MAG TPA: SDR family oxidoreductase [Caulobacteraceae bacterium]|nr:SDR family oxidoreductase [Caulobacteraceae bacterium]
MKVVVTGANRGIGLGLTQRYLEEGEQVFALCRTPGDAPKLRELESRYHGRLVIGRIDLGDKASIDEAAALVGDQLDILINNAGILGGSDQSLAGVDPDEWLRALDVIALGPFRVSRAFLPALRRSAGKIVFISSHIASSSWHTGGFYAYASGKAALNRIVRALARDVAADGIRTVAVHPGHVQTDLAAPGAKMTPAESAEGIFRLVSRLDDQMSGGFYKWNGEPHPF